MESVNKIGIKPCDFYSPDPMDYVRVALALETLAYHSKHYLDAKLQDNINLSEEIQTLLINAVETHEEQMRNK